MDFFLILFLIAYFGAVNYVMHNMRAGTEVFLGQNENRGPETAAQRALRDSSKEAAGKGQYMGLWWRGSSSQSSAQFIRAYILLCLLGYDHRPSDKCPLLTT